MEHSRLNRPCVIPDYGGAEIKALLRDPPHSSIVVRKSRRAAVSHSNVFSLCHTELADCGHFSKSNKK